MDSRQEWMHLIMILVQFIHFLCVIGLLVIALCCPIDYLIWLEEKRNGCSTPCTEYLICIANRLGVEFDQMMNFGILLFFYFCKQ